MKLTMLKSKLHRATVTQADLHYEGSISIDKSLMAAANLRTYEKVDIYNVDNGARFSTYIIDGRPGEICLNGAAARLVSPGNKVIICSYVDIDETELNRHVPTVVLLGPENQIKKPNHIERAGEINV